MKKLFAMGIMSILTGMFSCTAQTDGFKSVEADEFEKFIADTTVVRLDVRTAEEYSEGHIPGAINIDVTKDDYTAKATALPTDKAVGLYCRSGNRSKRAAKILSGKGYTVVELGSGIKGWAAAGKPIEK